ncbi:hypothetical protein J4E82_001049 [Alternaria postmessia]|uniref:uncharacterized protein n=1 Tax=Alternaria postmessia TaxID=1187938 RepID=UPI0022258684|nr:uncharacterized protein J4E82_001049 [Alternaria postmessia]KAI5379977.1 hypothetical protein J4E82_001049 [Alternaria postmessia]
MSPQPTALYLARIRDRIVAIRENTNTNATSLKTIITNTVRRDSLGRRGEAARQTLAASLGEYYDGSQESEHDLRDLSPVGDHLNGWDEEDGEQDWDVRSDSMEPLRDREGEEIDDGDDEYEEEREDWELDMDREHERYMEVDRSMSFESLIAEERFTNGEVESEMYVAYHSMNSRAMRKMRLHEVERMYQSGGTYSTVNKTKRSEMQDMLQKYSEEVPNFRRQDDEDDVVSTPYPEDDDLIPLTYQPNHGSLPTPNDTNKVNTNSSSELSILTNLYPEDAPTTQPQPPPPTQSPHSINRNTTPSTNRSYFPIYPSNRTISPISLFVASRHVPFPVSPSSTRSHVQFPIESGACAHNNDVEEREYAPTHPYYDMNQQETQEYWHGLQRYNTESERHLRRGEAPTNRRQRSASSPVQHRDERTLESAGGEYEHHVGDALEGEQGGQAGEKKVNLVGRLLSTLTCRPGAVSPNDAAVPVKHDQTVGMVSIVPRKYAMAFLSRKTGRTQRNEEEEEARLRERSLGLQIPPPHEKTTRDTGNTSRIREEAQQTPRAKRGHEDKQSRSKPRVVNVGSQTPSVIGPPVDLSKMIQRAPESIRTSSPSPGSDAEPLRMNVERVPRQAHSDSSSSLSDRLRKTKLEDLPLRFGAAEEIRNLMLTLERDQNGSTNIPIQHEDRLSGGVNSTTKLHTGQANELPGGFSRPENRQANRQYAQRVRAAKSHSSNLTLPPNFRAPEIHADSPSISLEPSRFMKLASAEDTGGMNLVEEDDDMDNSTEKQYDDIEDDVGMDDSAE